MSKRPVTLSLEPSVEEHLQLSAFKVLITLPASGWSLKCGRQGKFDVTDFVSSISEKLIAQSKANSERTCSTVLNLVRAAFTRSVSFRS
jgi:hypothetical protein